MSVSKAVEHQAALWVIRLERGLSGEEHDQFLEWLNADPRHGIELARQKANWTRLDLLAAARPADARRNRSEPASAWTYSLPGRQRKRRWLVAAGLGMAAAIALGLFLSRPATPDAGRERPAVSRAPIATIEHRTLPDGSILKLNRGAQASIHYAATERRVHLERGEANFEVMKDSQRPFIVRASGIDVRAIGTAFNVRLTNSVVEVTVTEGAVQVALPGETRGVGIEGQATPAVVAAGQWIVMSLEPAAPPPRVVSAPAAELALKLAWQPRLLDFTATPLQSIVQEFNRRNAPLQIVLADAALAETIVSASLQSDNLEGFIRLLEGGFEVTAAREGNRVTLRKAR